MAMFVICIFIISAIPSLGLSVTHISPSDHGKTILFHRHRSIGAIKIPYDHKGIIFYPSSTNHPFVINSTEIGAPRVIHLCGECKRDSKVRIDLLKDVLEGHPFEILSNTGSLFSKDDCVKRALSELGADHRGIHYNLLGNNCGNFVAWAKHGDSEADTQVRDFISNLSGQVNIIERPLMKLHRLIQSRIRKRAMMPDSLGFES